MGTLDGAMGKLAQTMVQKFGRPATISRKGEGFRDSTLGKTTHAETSSISCHVVLNEFNVREIDGTLVQHGDRKGIVSRLAVGYEPTINRDTLTEGGREWKILRLIGYSSGEQEAAYELHLRRTG